MKKYLKQHGFEYALSFVLVVMAAVGISVVFGYSFSTNDDAMLRNIVNGNYTGSPEAHLIYIMYPLGFLLKCGYEMFPHVPWYDIFMVGMHYICWFLIMVRIGQQFEKKGMKAVAVVISLIGLLMIDMPYLVMHQYTVLAALLASVAIFWLVTSKAEDRAEYVADRVVCIVFLTLCLWLRNQVFFMALPIGFFILLKEVLQEKKTKQEGVKILKKTGIFLASVLAVFLISFGIEKIAYGSEEWKDFKAYNEARTDIYDFYGIPSYEEYSSEYNNLGLSYGDWLVIDHYDSGLVESLDTEKILRIAELSKAEWEEPQQYYSVPRQILYSICETVLYNQIQPIGLILTVMYVVALFISLKRQDKCGILCLCGMLAFQAAFVGYFIWQGRFPERVSYGLYFMQFIYLTGIMLKNNTIPELTLKKQGFYFAIISLLCMVVLGCFGLYRVRDILNQQAVLEQNIADWSYVNDYFEAQSGNKYYIVTKSFVFSAEEMFGDSKTESCNIIRLGSWIQNSPLEEEHNSAQGISNMEEQLAQEDNFYIVQAAENDLEWLDSFYESNGYEVRANIADTITTPGGRSFYVIQMQ